MRVQNTVDLRSYYAQPEVVDQYLNRRFASPSGCFHDLSERQLVRESLATVRRVVEIACGPARFGLLAQHLRWHYLGVDISTPMLHLAHQRWPSLVFAQADAFALPVADQISDAALALRFIRHLTYPDRKQVYCEIYRILRPAGWLVFDACNEARHQHVADQRPVYDEPYTVPSLREELAAHGFRVQQLNGYLYQDTLIRCFKGAARRFWAWGWTLPLRWVYELRYAHERTLSNQTLERAYLWLVLCQKSAS